MAKLEIFHVQKVELFQMVSGSLSHFLEKIPLNQLLFLWTRLRSQDQWIPWLIPLRSPQELCLGTHNIIFSTENFLTTAVLVKILNLGYAHENDSFKQQRQSG